MSKESYFSKTKTGGANASSGLSFQDACALYHLIKKIDDHDFLSIGVETDDDFTLIYKDRKILFQVKLEELSVPLARNHIGENKILVGSTINKSLSTLLSYLKQYRNFMFSAESAESKDDVTKDFADILIKHDISNIPDSWTVETLSDTKTEELIELTIMSWGMQRELFINREACMQDLQLTISNKRTSRGFLDKESTLKILNKHSKKLDIEGVKKQQTYIDLIGIKKESILGKIDTKINQAEILLQDHRLQPALTIYADLAKTLESEQLYIKCASILHQLDEQDEAIAYCDKALATVPNLAYAQAIKGSALGEKGNYIKAIDFLQSANYNKPNDAIILYNLGVSLLKIKKIPEAISHFEQAILADKHFSPAHLNLGICLFSEGDMSTALEHIELCLILEPGLPAAISQKGEIKRFYGEVDEAQELFERCLLETPDNPVASKGLAFCLLDKGDPLGAPLLIKNFSVQVNALKTNKTIGIIDIGWLSTNAIAIKRTSETSYEINYNGMIFFMSEPAKDTIAITTLEVGEIKTPLIIKTYEREKDYKSALNFIKTGELINLVCMVDGFVKDLENHCEIKVVFRNLIIYGKTGACKNEGFNAFKSAYNDHCMLLLEHQETKQQRVFNLIGLKIN